MKRTYARPKIVLSVTGLLIALPSMIGCKSSWIDATVENRTGEIIRELEVDYPSASFGTNTLTPGATMHYRFQIQGEGPVRLQYTAVDGKIIHAQGLTLSDRQQGQLWMDLLPAGKVEFTPKLQPAS